MDQTMQRAQDGGGKGRAPRVELTVAAAQAQVASTGSLSPGTQHHESGLVTLQGCQDSSGEWEEIN